ncbi:ankyrin repeat domain-containing protein [Candidatus Dependentiae bacterium]|nr:ankyrin repeat domain-containing protein [Candidatus Dependentiae bacterium]
MFKKVLLISLFAIMPLVAEQPHQSYWNRFAPTAAAFQKSFMRPFVGFKVALSKYNPFRSFSSVFAPTIYAYSGKSVDDRNVKVEFLTDLVKNSISMNDFPVGRYHYYPHLIKTALYLGANPNHTDEDGRSALYQAAAGSLDASEESVKILLDNGANANKKNTNHKDTPLHIAACCGSEKNVQELIAAKADVNAQDKWGHTPLREAIYCEHPERVKILLENGAIVNDQLIEKVKRSKDAHCGMRKYIIRNDKVLGVIKPNEAYIEIPAHERLCNNYSEMLEILNAHKNK